MITTQRQVRRDVLGVNDVGSTILWGIAEDGVLNGGDRLSALIDNKNGAQILNVTIWVQTTRDDIFVADPTVIPCAAATQTTIELLDLANYAMRFTGQYAAANNDTVTVSVEVKALP